MNKILKWLDNYWYHYKWITIIVVFFAIFLIITIGQMIQKDSVDIHIMYAGPTAFKPEEIENIEDSFAQLVPDYNNDGKKVVQFLDITVLTDEQIAANKKLAEEEGVDYNPDMNYISDMRKKYSMQMVAGEAYILLLDPQMYDMYYDSGMYMTLDELGIDLPDTYDNSSVKFRETEFGAYFNCFEKFPEDTLFCFRKMSYTSEKKGKSEKTVYENQLDFMKKIYAFTSPK